MSVAIIKLPIHYTASATPEVAKERKEEVALAKDRLEAALDVGYSVIATSQVIQDRCVYEVFVMFMADEVLEDDPAASWLEMKEYITGDENHD